MLRLSYNVHIVTDKIGGRKHVSDLHTYEIPVAQPLAKAYMDGQQEVIETFYNYNVNNKEDWSKRLQILQSNAHMRMDKDELANILISYNKKYGMTPEMEQSIALIKQGAKVVIGGQQAGLWTGPLLVIHKVASIIKAAQEASSIIGEQVVPVFWVAGEDHDFDEVNHTYIISADQQLTKLAISKEDDSRTSISRTLFSESVWLEALAQLEQTLPGSEFKPALMEKLQAFVKQSQTLSDLFSYIIAELFGAYGLLLIDADYTMLRKAEKSMFHTLVEKHDVLVEAYDDAKQLIIEKGFTPQADFNRDSLNLFYFAKEQQQARLLLYKSNDQYTDRKQTVSFTSDQLFAEIDSSPEQFSNNVFTRPLMQDFIFPVLGVVLGPGEIAYWAMTKQAFSVMGMDMPIIIPRTSYTLVEGINQKNMDKYDLTFADVMEQFADKKAAWLYEQDELKVADQFEAVKANFISQYEPLIQLATQIQAGLGKLGDTNLTKIVEQINYLQNKTVDAQQKQFEAAIRQMDRIELSLKPQGKPQERVLSMMSYWNRYNTEWLDKIMDAPFELAGGHHIINL